MKQILLSKVFASAFLLAGSVTIQARHSWAMASLEAGSNWPSFTEYRCVPEKGSNGIEYLRLYEWGGYIRQERQNPVELKYGYRMSDKRIFVYDFEADEERLAFDFTLSAGDHFSTYNGMEWEVEAVKDTLVNISYMGEGECTPKHLLKVHSVDGQYSDQWLEDFGSFTNHFMILPMSKDGQAHTLWMEYDEGCYLTREISSDPLFAHGSGMPERPVEKRPEYCSCTYDDGTLFVERVGFRSPNREYACYYRVGDDLYCAYVWEMNPATDIHVVRWLEDIYCFTGLPAPENGTYTMHFNKEKRPSGIENPVSPFCKHPEGLPIFDLQGGLLPNVPSKGLYISGGRICVAKH